MPKRWRGGGGGGRRRFVHVCALLRSMAAGGVDEPVTIGDATTTVVAGA